MAINPPSDLILDVARAADPTAARAAAERLKALSLQRTAAGTEAPDASSPPPFALPATSEADAGAPRIVKKPDSYTKFEAFVLQTFIQSMFSGEKDQDVFGKGTSGQYWKSMLSGAIADQMAQSGGIGIAKMLRSEAAQKEVASATTGAAATAARSIEGSLDVPAGASAPALLSPASKAGNSG